MRYLFVLPLVTALQGCWFFVFPLPRVSSNEPGNTCINAGYYAGDKIKNLETNKIGVVEKVYGESARCKDKAHPHLADVRYE